MHPVILRSRRPSSVAPPGACCGKPCPGSPTAASSASPACWACRCWPPPCVRRRRPSPPLPLRLQPRDRPPGRPRQPAGRGGAPRRSGRRPAPPRRPPAAPPLGGRHRPATATAPRRASAAASRSRARTTFTVTPRPSWSTATATPSACSPWTRASSRLRSSPRCRQALSWFSPIWKVRPFEFAGKGSILSFSRTPLYRLLVRPPRLPLPGSRMPGSEAAATGCSGAGGGRAPRRRALVAWPGPGGPGRRRGGRT